jgi:hypothetical protein
MPGANLITILPIAAPLSRRNALLSIEGAL